MPIKPEGATACMRQSDNSDCNDFQPYVKCDDSTL